MSLLIQAYSLVTWISTILAMIPSHMTGSALHQLLEHPGINPSYLFIPRLFKEGGFVMFNTAVFEFLCCQSSCSLMGLLIGMFFCIRELFQLLGVLFLFPFLCYPLHLLAVGILASV